MSHSKPADTPTPRPTPWAALHAALMPDYNRPATVYWWTMVVLGALAIGWSVRQVAGLSFDLQLQIAVGCLVAIVAGMFPVRVPGSKNSFAAGEVFIVLLLLVYGPAAGALAAAGEVFIGAIRTSKRWTSRLISPAVGAVSMLITGTALHAVAARLDLDAPDAQAGMMVLAMVFATANFLINLVLITLVPHLKARQPMRLETIASSFGWVGTVYAASALIAGLLYLVFKASGLGVMAGALPLFIVLLVMLHYHFRQRESDTEAQRQRVEAAEREAAAAARHLAALRASEERFHQAFSHAAIGMALVSPAGVVLQVNGALCTLLGRPEGELVGTTFQSFVHPSDEPTLQRCWYAALGGNAPCSAIELRCLRPGGELVHVALHGGRFLDGSDTSACMILQAQDVTARRDAEARLQHIAYHDALTSLPNRVRFGECLAEAIARSKRDARYQFAVMYLDFDRFKLINDTQGHAVGDAFLTMAAHRIRDLVRPGDTVGRLGGDEFAVLVDGVADEMAVMAMAARLHRALAQPYRLDANEVNSTASIGITFSSIGYDTPGEVLRDADIAMYRAKSAGRARTALFDASLRAQLAAQVDLERDLRRALDEHQLTLAFQPIFDLQTGRVDSLEALVRWTHPERGAVPPSTFVPIAEDSALIGQLTEGVLASACAHLRRFEQAHPGLGRRPRMHVNVSGTDMCRPGFVAQVAAALLANRLEPAQLTLEITESTLMQHLDSALEAMGQLRDLGVGLSVDDFGTGYSSLAYLSTLPITSLKIDRSFVQRLHEQARDAEVVRAVITLGRALGKTVIAEGIETAGQLAQLRELGCGLGQGYLLGRPMTAERAATALVHERPWPRAEAGASEFGRFVETLPATPLTLH